LSLVNEEEEGSDKEDVAQNTGIVEEKCKEFED